jgi:hypothetical protein
MCAEPLDHRRTGLVKADHFNKRTVPTKLQDDVIQRADCSDVPDMCAAYVDADALGTSW